VVIAAFLAREELEDFLLRADGVEAFLRLGQRDLLVALAVPLGLGQVGWRGSLALIAATVVTAMPAVGAILAIALIAAFYVARAVTVPLKKLTTAAYTLSTDKLPALVERLRNPDEASAPLSETLTAIDINSKDEIGQLADAFNSIQHVTVEVAEEQGALLRKGIGDIFINLARRNQTLLDRQIEFIDQLEANEEDPDQLDNLFKLDHLATRMRRNAESLLVLGGGPTGVELAQAFARYGVPTSIVDHNERLLARDHPRNAALIEESPIQAQHAPRAGL